MLTHGCIGGLAMYSARLDDDGIWCVDCLRWNFGGQTVPDSEVPRIEVMGLGRRRAASEHIAARHREETDHAG